MYFFSSNHWWEIVTDNNSNYMCRVFLLSEFIDQSNEKFAYLFTSAEYEGNYVCRIFQSYEALAYEKKIAYLEYRSKTKMEHRPQK